LDTKVETVRVEQMLPPPSAILETSPGNFQWVYILDGGADPQEAATALERLAAAEITDAGAKDASHVFRLPGSINDKVAVLGNVLRLAGVRLSWRGPRPAAPSRRRRSRRKPSRTPPGCGRAISSRSPELSLRAAG
jgi:hypothetical protein